ncbi:SDR family NAD(P)-dependent oxidoreductase [Metabacillus herbersteinensis]|uniref:SDR family NAD(P)-dependent oxidoreductase n=1 Tax=Metabacillus herbersteinensis TaxID=283816 RepID=A0ABV6GAC5_9BACI
MKYFPDLENKKVIVTGGSKGIGKDIALSFAEHGAQVIITGRDIDSLEQATHELRRYQPTCKYVAADISKTKEVFEMIDTAAEHLGTIDILVNNAGLNIAKPALEVTEEDWDKVLDTNLKGAFFASQRAAKYMIHNKAGKIINIASQMAFVGYLNRAAYCSSKGGIVQQTKALAIEWAPYNINVNAVAPTFIKTDFTEKMFEDKAFEKDVYQRIPLGRLASPQDVTGAVLYLSSNLANFVTGETIKVDGGWTAI